MKTIIVDVQRIIHAQYKVEITDDEYARLNAAIKEDCLRDGSISVEELGGEFWELHNEDATYVDSSADPVKVVGLYDKFADEYYAE